jgi:hypothetical protein
MPAISEVTRATIKGYLEGFIEGKVQEYKERKIPTLEKPQIYLAKRSSKGHLKPFHSAIIPHELMRLSSFERGFSTGLGTSYEECARLIALEHHAGSQRAYDLTGEVSLAAHREIDRQVSAYEHASESTGPKPTFEQMLQAVFLARRDDTHVSITVRADLQIAAHDGTAYLFEIKSPVPNKGQCLEVAQRLLRFHLILDQPRPAVQAYYAMAYNPYGPDRSHYKWSNAKKYFPFDQAMLIGHEFWNLVGGQGVYEELLEIYQEVGREKTKYILDALAYGF